MSGEVPSGGDGAGGVRWGAAEGAAYPSALGRALRMTAAKLLLALFSVRVVDAENIPAGAAVLCANHVSYMDPVLMWCGTPRIVHFMAKRQLWNNAFLRLVVPRVWAFPVNRDGTDRSAITMATRLLSEGRLVGVFPEGTRTLSGDGLGQAHGGAAFVALHAGAPIVPVGIAGTDRVWPRGKRLPRLARVTIKFGEPVPPEAFASGGRKERVGAMTAEVMRRIAEELETARRL